MGVFRSPLAGCTTVLTFLLPLCFLVLGGAFAQSSWERRSATATNVRRRGVALLPGPNSASTLVLAGGYQSRVVEGIDVSVGISTLSVQTWDPLPVVHGEAAAGIIRLGSFFGGSYAAVFAGGYDSSAISDIEFYAPNGTRIASRNLAKPRGRAVAIGLYDHRFLGIFTGSGNDGDEIDIIDGDALSVRQSVRKFREATKTSAAGCAFSASRAIIGGGRDDNQLDSFNTTDIYWLSPDGQSDSLAPGPELSIARHNLAAACLPNVAIFAGGSSSSSGASNSIDKFTFDASGILVETLTSLLNQIDPLTRAGPTAGCAVVGRYAIFSGASTTNVWDELTDQWSIAPGPTSFQSDDVDATCLSLSGGGALYAVAGGASDGGFSILTIPPPPTTTGTTGTATIATVATTATTATSATSATFTTSATSATSATTATTSTTAMTATTVTTTTAVTTAPLAAATTANMTASGNTMTVGGVSTTELSNPSTAAGSNPTEFQTGTASSSQLPLLIGSILALACCLMIAAIAGFIWHKRRVAENNLSYSSATEEFSTNLTVISELETSRAKILDGVQINRLIGQGVGGSVFSGTWLGSDVALKLPIGTASDIDVTREINFLVDNTHPSIIQFLGAARNVSGLENANEIPADLSGAPRIWLVFEFAEKGDVLRWLRLERPSVTEILNVMADVASGLMFLASRSIVHRDVSCRNILVKAGPRGALTDLGLARTTNSDAEYKMQSTTSLPVRWCSPELLGQGTASPSSDIFSLGTTMHEALSNGVQPFVGLSNSEVAEHIMGGSDEMSKFLTQPTLCPDAVYELMRRCWNFDPISRPSAEEVRDILRAQIRDQPQRQSLYVEISNDVYSKTPAHHSYADNFHSESPVVDCPDIARSTIGKDTSIDDDTNHYGRSPVLPLPAENAHSSEQLLPSPPV